MAPPQTPYQVISATLYVAFRVATWLFIVEQIEPLEYFTSQAVMRNHQLAEVGSMRELAQANLRLRKAELMPEVVAMGGVTLCNYQLSSLVPRMAVGVGLNFRIFDGLRSEYRTASARLQLRRAEALEQKAKQDVVLLVEDSYNRLQSILTTAFAVERSERFAREYLRSKQLAYREGMATTTDVVDAALNLSRAQLERAQMAFEFDVALARLLEVSGVGNLFVKYLNGATTKLIY